MDNIGEVLFLAKCMELDLIASRPYAPCKYDFIVDNSDYFIRIDLTDTKTNNNSFTASETPEWLKKDIENMDFIPMDALQFDNNLNT